MVAGDYPRVVSLLLALRLQQEATKEQSYFWNVNQYYFFP